MYGRWEAGKLICQKWVDLLRISVLFRVDLANYLVAGILVGRLE